MKIQNGISIASKSAEERAVQLDGQMREAAKMYESHFLNEMVKSMRKTAQNDDGLIKTNMAEKIFREQLDGQYVEGWTNKGGVGLADMIYMQLKDRYQAGTKQNFLHRGGVMPIAPRKDAQGIAPTDSIQMKMLPPTSGYKLEYRFDVPDASGAFDAQLPLEGHVVESAKLADGWNVVKLDHGRGLTSELTFPGQLAPFDTAGRQNGSEPEAGLLPAGQKLGVIDPGRPVLAWKLDWIEG